MNRLWTGIRKQARGARVLACGASAILLGAMLPEGREGAVTSVSVEPSRGQAQVVIGVDGAVSVRDFVLRNPDRIVVDVYGARLGVPHGGYDRIARGGVLDVRYAQNQRTVVRVVLTLAGPKQYRLTRATREIRVAVDGGGEFAAWRSGSTTAAGVTLATARISVDTPPPTVPLAPTPTVPLAPTPVAPSASVAQPTAVQPSAEQQVPRAQPVPRITIAWENADIRDVLAAFAAFSGRTIIPAKGVDAKVTAEIVDKPWDVAMRAILNAYGFDAVEDQNGIIIVNTIESVAARPRTEALVTRTVQLNYTKASSVAANLQSRLTRDCPPAAVPTPTAATGCQPRGAVTADTLTNSVSITDVVSALPDLVSYALSLDIRQPQVNIKAKIVLVDRSRLEGLGLKYDLGSRNQHFNDLVQRRDSLGNPETGNIIFLGGNTVSAIANAAQSVPAAALRLIHSAAIGAFSFTTFLEALQDQSILDVQAEPSVTTLNNRVANLSAGTAVPVRTIVQGAAATAGAFPTATVSIRQVGILLTVTPQITRNRQIQMKIHAENSDVQFQSSDVGAVFPTQSVDNELLVADGETAVMGGLTQTSVRVTKTGIPILVDLPLIGRLFGVTNRQETKRDLLILITPHIVDEGDMAMEPRR